MSAAYFAVGAAALGTIAYALKWALWDKPNAWGEMVDALTPGGEITKKLAARYAPGNDVPSPLSGEWLKYSGARPELRGAPANTILAVKGLEGLSAEARGLMLDIAEASGIPVDSLAAVMSSESGLNPAAAYKLPNGQIFAAGLFQLTTGANLAGFTSKEAIAEVVKKTAEEQLDQIARPYFQRFKPKSPRTQATLAASQALRVHSRRQARPVPSASVPPRRMPVATAWGP